MRNLLLMLPILILASVEARAASCLEDAGSGISQRLVLQCLEVSNNSRRCKAENTCAGLRAEIEAGCGEIDHSKPKFCNSPRGTPANSCREAAGAANAQKLVLQCLEVSDKTQRCKAENSCSVLLGEIRSGCKQIDRSKPRFCSSY